MVYLIWSRCDGIDPTLVGVATDENKAKEMKDKLVSTYGFEYCNFKCNIIPVELNTLTIYDVDYKF